MLFGPAASAAEAGAAGNVPAPDFSSDEGALAYANQQLDKLVEAMREHLAKHITGWPIDARDRELNTYEALRHLLRNISFGHAGYVEADYENPTFTKMGGTNRIQFQLQSTDCNYHMAVLHGDYRYRLRGYRGTSAIFQIEIGSGSGATPRTWKVLTVANNIDHPALAAGKTIDVILSRDKPADLGDATWLPLPEGHCEIHLRQYYADWDKELPADLILTREDQTFPSALLTRDTSEVRFQRLVDLLKQHANFYRIGVQNHLKSPPEFAEAVVVPGAFEGTQYFFGQFRCRPDQAVVIEIDAPKSLYWNVELAQMQWEPGDYWSKLVSYNMTQVRAEPDGKVRWIASWTDPGVPNWFDCSGRNLTLIGFRFFRSEIQQTRPRLRTIALSDLRKHIPKGTPKVTAEERTDLMRRRLYSIYRRKFNDF